MNDFAVIISIIALCFFWCAFRERSEGNRTDSLALAGLGTLSGVSGLGLFIATA
ncbi:hypothetical protein [Noviherbaspirillum malthae]|jgi:hypothetical protein|uniref:hypothetical protein n=1 Tax=Noviherbaspirillum malthae TaxID=1260987 RepID=UPI00189050CB|nr:hypothetical protein [Noviherbaspirillum malthae]